MAKVVVMAVCAGLALVSAGCGRPPDGEDRAKAAQSVGLLLEHDGVRIYRFSDNGRYHYYAVAVGGRSVWTMSGRLENCGKHCSRWVEDDIQTVAR